MPRYSFFVLGAQVVVEQSHLREDIQEDRLSIRADGILDPTSEARLLEIG